MVKIRPFRYGNTLYLAFLYQQHNQLKSDRFGMEIIYLRLNKDITFEC